MGYHGPSAVKLVLLDGDSDDSITCTACGNDTFTLGSIPGMPSYVKFVREDDKVRIGEWLGVPTCRVCRRQWTDPLHLRSRIVAVTDEVDEVPDAVE